MSEPTPSRWRFVIFRQTRPVAVCDTVQDVTRWLLGRDLRAQYVVLDGELAVLVDDGNLTAWATRHWPGEVD